MFYIIPILNLLKFRKKYPRFSPVIFTTLVQIKCYKNATQLRQQLEARKTKSEQLTFLTPLIDESA